MTHGDAIIDGDGVEFLGHTTGLFDLARYQLPHVFQVHMPRHKLRKRI